MLQKVVETVKHWYWPHDSQRDQADRPSSTYVFDDDLIYCEDFCNAITVAGYDEELASSFPFPKDETLAHFSNLAYQSDGFRLTDGWQFLTTATNESNKYFGVAFWNPQLRQVVVAHRGTDLKVWGALKADASIFMRKEKSKQAQSAATFVHYVVKAIESKMEQHSIYIQLSITGHSLGAWLAQITTFTIKYFKLEEGEFVPDDEYVNNIHAHTVVFDSPGCRESLQKLVKRFVPHRYSQRKFGNYRTLDMTVYLNDPNFINSGNEHVGFVYVTDYKTHSLPDDMDSPDTSIGKKVALDFPLGRGKSFKLFFKRLLWLLPSGEHVPTTSQGENEYSLNVFSEQERDFISWLCAISSAFPQSDLPQFEIDYDRHVIRSDNLMKTIATIKRLQTSREELLQEHLQDDKTGTILCEKLKWETRKYQKNLLPLHGYYFSDQYRLQEFLVSEKRVLHICLDAKTDIAQEMGILNNVFRYYQENRIHYEQYFEFGRYAFVDEWKKLHEPVKANVFESFRVNLLVADCSYADSEDMDAVRQLLATNGSIKVVTLSTGLWKDETFFDASEMEEVEGFAHSLTFKKLTECSQDKLLAQKKLRFLGEQMSLQDVIKHTHFLSGDHLLRLLLQPADETIAINLQRNVFLNAVCFLDLHREMELTEGLIKSDPNLRYIVEDESGSDFTENLESIFAKSCRQDVQIVNKVDFEAECCNSQESVYLFKANGQKLFLTKIHSGDFYMTRYVHHKKCVSDEIFQATADADLYYFCGNEAEFLEKTRPLTEETRERFRYRYSEGRARKELQFLDENAHLLKIENGRTLWIDSNKKISGLRRFIQTDESFIPENELMEGDNLVILAGNAGEGKSSTIGHLFEHHRKEKHWVFAIPLKHGAFGELPEEPSFDAAAKFILKTCNTPLSNFAQYLLSYCLKHETKLPVYLLFDAFDEIHEEDNRKKLVRLLEFLKSQSKAKILITTRIFKCEELENRLATFAYSFRASTYQAQLQDFFAKFWHTQVRLFTTAENLEEVKDNVKSLLENAEDSLGRTILNFKGTPLYLRMIAEIKTQSFVGATRQFTITNILELYHDYLQLHYKIYFQRSESSGNKVQQRWLKKSISAKLRELAVAELQNTRLNHDVKELEELSKVGLVAHSQGDVEFLHESIRDYFVAEALELWLKSYYEAAHENLDDVAQFIVTKFLVKPEYKDMRFFLNSKLSTLMISDGRIKECRDKVALLAESAFVNDDGECVFHVCANEDLCLLMKCLLFDILPVPLKSTLLGLGDSKLETALFLALGNDSPENKPKDELLFAMLDEIYSWPNEDDVKTVLLAALFNHFVNVAHLNNLIDFSKSYTGTETLLENVRQQFWQISRYLDACESGKKDLLSATLRKFRTDPIAKRFLLAVTNSVKETGLHLAPDCATAKLLVQSGVDINRTDEKGMTALSRCIKASRNKDICKDRTDTVKMLIAAGADVTIADGFGNTALHHAAKYDNISILNILLNLQKIDVDERNVFQVTPLLIAARYGSQAAVGALIRKGADVKASERNQRTVVHSAARANHAALMGILKNAGADINAVDRDGATPLLLAMQRGHFDAANSLVDRGADVDICWEEMEKVLKGKRSWTFLKKIEKVRAKKREQNNRTENATTD